MLWGKNKKQGKEKKPERKAFVKTKGTTTLLVLIILFGGLCFRFWLEAEARQAEARQSEVEALTSEPFKAPSKETVAPKATAFSTVTPTATIRPTDPLLQRYNYQGLLVDICNSNLAVTTASEALDHLGTDTPTLTAVPILKPEVSLEIFSKEMVILDIPVIGVRSRIETALPTEKGDGLDFSRLHQAPLWVSSSRKIGEPGVALVLGHRQWGPAPKVFAKLNQLKTEDIVQVVTRQYTFFYIVEKPNIVIDPTDVWNTLEELDTEAIEFGKSILALLTCTPYGTDWQRLMVLTKLEEVYEN